MAAAIPHPNNLDDVVTLIHRLFQPGSPEELSRIQDILQKVQRSPEGWQLADHLLERQDQHVRFFGALTFTVKLNSDWESVSEGDVPVLCTRLIAWLVRIVNEGAPPLVVKKLCSTLVVFFVRFADSWANCVRHLICCLAAGRAAPESEFADMPASSRLLSTMGPGAKLAALWFTTILVEEVGKVDTKNIKNHHYCVKIQENEAEAVELIKDTIEMPNGVGNIPENFDARIVDGGLKAFQSWVLYSLRAFIDFRIEFPLLRTLTQTAIHWLASEDMFEAACDVVIDILSLSFSFLTAEDKLALANILTSPWAVERYELLISGDTDWGSIQFARLLVTYAEATVQKLAKSLNTPSGRAMIEMLHGILNIPGYAQVEDEVSGSTFEFWSSLVEFLVDNEGEDDSDEPWIQDCHKEVKRAVEEFWKKIRIPNMHELQMWTKDQMDGFMSYRKDAADFVESAYGLLGPPLFLQLVDQVVNALAPGGDASWQDIEASLFCLNALSDLLGDEPYEDVYMERLFGSNVFSMLVDPAAEIPLKARTTSVNLIGSYAPFFERKPDYLPPALNFLFTCLSTPVLARNASRSISSLCSSCRCTLTGELSAFLRQYEIFAASPNADDLAKEKVLCAISYVIQALPSEEQKFDPISELLGYVEKDAEKAIILFRQGQGQEDEAKETGLLALRCLVSIGKGLQAPDDLPVDLSEEEGPQLPSFWEASTGGILQEKIINLVRMLCGTFNGDGEMVDAACAVFKTGFAETVPGLFVFPPERVTDFLLEHCARTETILSTAGTLISSHSTSNSADIVSQVLQLLQFVINPSGTAVLFAKTNLQMRPAQLAMISVVSTITGVAGAFTWPRISKTFNRTPSQTILICMCVFLIIPIYGLLGFIPAIQEMGFGGLTSPWEMYLLGAVYGFVLGGISGYCRSVFGELIPPGSEAAFYALYAVTDKGSSIFGPTIVGLLTDKYGDIRVAFWFLAALLLAPLPLIYCVDVSRGKREGKALAREELRIATVNDSRRRGLESEEYDE